jgi:acetyltransferase-like isoleucine patch superfamily enzyme
VKSILTWHLPLIKRKFFSGNEIVIRSNKAQIDATAEIGHNTVIMDDVVVGRNSIIGNSVTIYPDTKIGDGVRIFDNSVLGRVPLVAGVIDRKPSGKLSGLVIGDHSVIGASVVLYTGSIIGNNVLISDLSSIREECNIGDDVVIGRSVIMNYNIVIGNKCRIMDGCHFGGDMILEDNVFLGPFVCSANDSYMGIKKEGLVRRGAIIKRNAKIGANTTLLANIEIGENALIGAGAVVTKSIPAGKLAYGVPAKVVKNVEDCEIR